MLGLTSKYFKLCHDAHSVSRILAKNCKLIISNIPLNKQTSTTINKTSKLLQSKNYMTINIIAQLNVCDKCVGLSNIILFIFDSKSVHFTIHFINNYNKKCK